MGNVHYLPVKKVETNQKANRLAILYLETVKMACVVYLTENKIALPRQGIGLFSNKDQIVVFNRKYGGKIADISVKYLANRMGVTPQYLLSIIPKMEIIS